MEESVKLSDKSSSTTAECFAILAAARYTVFKGNMKRFQGNTTNTTSLHICNPAASLVSEVSKPRFFWWALTVDAGRLRAKTASPSMSALTKLRPPHTKLVHQRNSPLPDLMLGILFAMCETTLQRYVNLTRKRISLLHTIHSELSAFS